MTELIQNRYAILQKLGKGGMGTVYLVEDTLNNNQVLALKVIRADLLNERAVTQFKAEFEALAQLRHPNLVQVYEFSGLIEEQQAKQQYFFTMEYVAGEDWPTLAQRHAQDAPQDFTWLYDVLVQICRALQYIHSRGFIHYDLKPSNVRITPTGQVKLMDFGLIGRLQHGSERRARGTPAYIAPELIRGDAVDHRVDLYSLGISLYEIITGQLPFDDSSSALILQIQEPTPITLPPEAAETLPAPLRDLIHTLLAKDPADRPEGANTIIREINAMSERAYALETRETLQGYIHSGAFVGRESELARLQGLLVRTQHGQGQLVFIAGPEGIGKSRLVHEVRRRAQMQGVLVCEGICHEHARIPYRPWLAIFRQVIAHYKSAQPELLRMYDQTLVRLMPELSEALDNIAATDFGPEEHRHLLSAAANFLRASQQPLMIVLEDLHYADAETITLLRTVGEQTQEGRLLVIGLYRDDELAHSHPLAALVAEAKATADAATATCELLRLGLLDEAAIETLVKSMLDLDHQAPAPLPPALLPWLINESGGNPVFIENLLHSLVEGEQLWFDGEAWHIAEKSLDRTATNIQAAARRRLQSLDAPTLELLQWAAVMGRWVNIDLLADVVSLSEEEFNLRIEQAVQHYVLVAMEREQQHSYRFSNDQMRAAIYHTLAPEERARRHAQIGDALRERYPKAEVIELMAWHFEQAGEYSWAQRYARIAGDKARQVYANDSAVQHYTRALGFIDAGQTTRPPDVIYEILAGRAEAYRLLGDLQAQLADLNRMAGLAARINDPQRQIQVALHQAEVSIKMGHNTYALETAEEALRLSRDLGDRRLQASSLDEMGGAHYAVGDLNAALACHEAALEICRELNDVHGEAHNLWHLGAISRLLGNFEASRRYAETSLALYRQINDRPGEADALNELAILSEDYAEQRDYHEQSLAIAHAIGDPDRQSRSYNNLAITYWALGLYNRGREMGERAVQIQREMHGRSRLVFLLETLGRVYLALEAYKEAQEVFAEGQALAQEIGDRTTESIYAFQMGRVLLANGQPEEAREWIKLAYDVQHELNLRAYLSSTSAWLGATCLALGDEKAADAYTQEALEMLEAAGAGEYPLQEVWWLRYQVLRAAEDASATDKAPASDAAWDALQNARTVMMKSIASLSDEGLRRNYLNKIEINQHIVTEWTRQLAKRHEGQILDEALTALTPASQAEDAARLQDRLERILDIGVRMNETHDAESLLNFVMEQVIELSGAEQGFLVLLDEDRQFDFKVAIGMDPDALAQGAAEISYTVLGTVMESQTPVLLQDALADERFKSQSSVLELNLRSVFCVPLVADANLIGMIYADNRSVSGRFSQTDLDLMMIFANQAATAIENAHLYEKLVTANQKLMEWTHTLETRVDERTRELQEANATLSHRAVQLEASSQVSKQLTSILGLDPLLSEIVSLIREQFGYYFVGVWLLDESKEQAVLRAGISGKNHRHEQRGLTIPLNAPSLIAWVCRHGIYRMEDHVAETPDYFAFENLPDIASEIALPLIIGDELVGALDIASDQVAAFTTEDRVVLQSLADQIAVAIRNARLYEAEQRRRQLTESLEEAGRALSSSLDLSEVPHLILKLLHDLVPYERGMVFLQQDAETLAAVAHYNFPDAERAREMQISIREGDVYQQLCASRTPNIINDVTQEPGWQQTPWLPLNSAWLGVLLISKDKPIGMISLTRREAGSFSAEDATWVQAFAAQASSALENARLYAEISQLNETLEQRVRERTEELNRAYRNLERLDKTKSNFINIAAHELRTPLTVVKGYGQMIRNKFRQEGDEQFQRITEGIVEGAERLHEIVNSMLDIAKIDSQTLQMIKAPISIAEIAQQVVDGFVPTLAGRNLNLTTSGLDLLPKIEADPDLLAKVFHHLIINAIKYTPDGGQITISGEVRQRDGRPEIMLTFSDTGIGIAPEDQELIFEKFYHPSEVDFHSSGRTKFKGGGPGLGLAIVRGIVQAHGGEIWAESEGCDEDICPGSQFHVTLPLT
ncbi:MAG: protein kinase domain-containing protein [Anaerolineales bacterium]